MVRIVIDGHEHEVREEQNLLQAMLELGYDLPYFCWHPAMGSVGACRQCAVKQYRDPDDTTGMIIMACMTPVSDGLLVSLDDPEAKELRSSVINWLMTNHPHDCPVCDEGGECHLQDMTVMVGHHQREHRFAKRTYRNQYLGPFLVHEMNRCIQCYRCVRFYRDYAGGADLNVFGSRNRVYFGRVKDGVLESPFSGNLAEVCPTGVFTDKAFGERSVRAWDLQTAPSICPHCSLGCNTLPGERNGELRRVRNRYHGEVNRYFLCDRGRYGWEYVNSPKRIRQPKIRMNGELGETNAATAIDRVANLVGDGAVGIGSTRASLEANFALRRLVGADNFFMGIGADEAEQLNAVADALDNHPAVNPSLREVELADAVLILGEDPTNTAPLLDLALRQAALNVPAQRARDIGVPDWNDAVVRLMVNRDNGPFFIATPATTGLDAIATETVRATPPDIALLGHAVVRAIESDGALTADLPDGIAGMASSAAAALVAAKRPLIVAGTGSGDAATIHAAAAVARALHRLNPSTALSLVVPDCNSVGAALLAAPHLGDAVKRDRVGTVIALEPDPSSRERRAALTTLLDTADDVVVLDHLESDVTDHAAVILPAATTFESNGTLVNNEGRAQRFYQVFVPSGDVLASWRWLAAICQRVHGDETASWTDPEEIATAMAAELPVLGPVSQLVPAAHGRPPRPVPRQSHRVTGRTAINAHLDIREQKPPADNETPMAFSMEGSPRRPPADLVTRYWSPGWNSVQGLTRFQEEIGGALRGGDPGVLLVGLTPGRGETGVAAKGEAFVSRNGQWLLVPLHHIFGSERLSRETQGIAELMPEPYLGLNPDDAQRLGVEPGDVLSVAIDGHTHALPYQPVKELPNGCAGLPEGLPGIAELPAGRWVQIERAP